MKDVELTANPKLFIHEAEKLNESLLRAQKELQHLMEQVAKDPKAEIPLHLHANFKGTSAMAETALDVVASISSHINGDPNFA